MAPVGLMEDFLMVGFRPLVAHVAFFKWRLVSWWEVHAACGSSLHFTLQLQSRIVDDLWLLGGFPKKSGQPVAGLEFGTVSSYAPHASH